ncbi:hypothetical protein QBE52_03335 [Clostridiaceae bacterium 35-E11]
MASKEQLQAVANHCSQFQSVHEGTFQASLLSDRTCENCKHFTKEHQCDIDLVDEVLSTMANDEC